MEKRIEGLVRKHTCSCGHSWEAPIVLSDNTTNLSGEKSQYCLKCGKRSFTASVPYKPTADNN